MENSKFANEYFVNTGFTTSIEDCFPPDSNFFTSIKSKINEYDYYISLLLFEIFFSFSWQASIISMRF